MPVEDIEDILISFRPLNNEIGRDSISCHLLNDSIDISRYPKECGNWKLFFHSTKENTINVFFILYPYLKFIKNREDLIPKNEVAVLSGKNVFRMLGIEYSHNPDGLLDDLHDLSKFLKNNWDRILLEFSDKNIKKTYNIVVSMEGNEEREINRVIKTLHNLVD